MSFTQLLVPLCNMMEFKKLNFSPNDNLDFINYRLDQTVNIVDYVDVNYDDTEKTVVEFESILGGTIYIYSTTPSGTSYQVTYKLYEDDGLIPIKTIDRTHGGFYEIDIVEGHQYRLTITDYNYSGTKRTYLRGKIGLKDNPKLLFHTINNN